MSRRVSFYFVSQSLSKSVASVGLKDAGGPVRPPRAEILGPLAGGPPPIPLGDLPPALEDPDELELGPGFGAALYGVLSGGPFTHLPLRVVLALGSHNRQLLKFSFARPHIGSGSLGGPGQGLCEDSPQAVFSLY